ncbi:hypothetical protein [Rhodococcus sp. 14-2483-1-1]|nr:hypothetical protein [Rhodococcus sp. 14-2483-1-1]
MAIAVFFDVAELFGIVATHFLSSTLRETQPAQNDSLPKRLAASRARRNG